MRNPDRIDIICNELARQWKRYPDWRFMQMINGFTVAMRSDCFYMEDEPFIDNLKEWLDGIFGKEDE